MTSLDYYKILRLKSSATPKEINLAYGNLLILYGNLKDKTAKEIMELIDEAHLVLRNPDTRANYDLERIVTTTKYPSESGSSKAEKIITSWRQGFTADEQMYLDKAYSFNKVIQATVFVVAIFFIWSAISFRWDISFLLMFGTLFLRVILGAIYRIKNPPPLLEVWATNKQ